MGESSSIICRGRENLTWVEAGSMPPNFYVPWSSKSLFTVHRLVVTVIQRAWIQCRLSVCTDAANAIMALSNPLSSDLKPENILLDFTGHIALCDFGTHGSYVAACATDIFWRVMQAEHVRV